MRILISSRMYLPRVGGVQLSIHQLAGRMRQRGHDVAVLTAADEYRNRSALAIATARLRRPPDTDRDDQFGYRVFRARDAAVGTRTAAAEFEPDAVVANVGGRTTLEFTRRVIRAARPLPTVAYVRDIEGVDLFGRHSHTPDAILTNAARISELVTARGLSVAATIPSVVETDAYRTDTSRRVVLFVNPRSERKGASTAWALAEARPDVPFVFLEAWRFTPEQRANFEQRAARLGNVTIRPSVADPGQIYSDARILFAPYEDSRPRVVAEAQASGIPVLAARVPGLVETVGPGGLFVEPEAPIEDWTRALGQLWDDPAEYARVAAAAEAHGQREEIRPDWLAERFELVLEQLLATRADAAPERS